MRDDELEQLMCDIALSPNFNAIIIARKPYKESCVDNVINWGVGGINIDECRVPLESDYEYKETNRKPRTENTVFDNNHSGFKSENNNTAVANPKGRFPSNVILTYDNTNEQEVCGGFPYTKGSMVTEKGTYGYWFDNDDRDSKPMADGYDDDGSASRYFKNCKYSDKDVNVIGEIELEDEKTYRLINGNMLEELDKLNENSIDSIVTDPPYELNFMSKDWDNAGISFQKETWEKCLRVLKPRRISVSFWWFKNIS